MFDWLKKRIEKGDEAYEREEEKHLLSSLKFWSLKVHKADLVKRKSFEKD